MQNMESSSYSHTKKINNPVEIQAKDINRQFMGKKLQMARRHKMLNSAGLREKTLLKQDTLSHLLNRQK